MARPLVLVFQELAAPTATPTIPDLNTVIVGPAYDLLDYPDDAALIQLTAAYGQLDQATTYVPPAVGADAVTVLAGGYPSQTPGSAVDHDSVAIWLKYPRVILGSTVVGITPVVGTHVTTNSLDQTLVTLVGGVSGQGFVAAGIRAGDRIVLTCSAGTVSRVVASVGEPNAAGLVPSGNEIYLRLTQNLPSTWDFAGNTEIRVERDLPIQQLADSTHTLITFPEPGSDTLVLKGGITLSVTLTPAPTVAVPSPGSASALRTLSYSQLYLSYRALRQDLQDILNLDSSALQSVSGVPTVVGIGKIDARNPLAVGVSVALQNSGTAPIYAYGVSSNDLVGHANARDAMSNRRDLFCFVPLTQDIDVIAAYKTEFEALADPLQALADGVVQKFRIVVGSVPLPTARTISQGSISGAASQSGVKTNLYRTITLYGASTGSISVNTVVPGDTVTIGLVPGSAGWQKRRGSHVVSHVNDSDNRVGGSLNSILEVIPGTSRWDDTAGVGTSGVGDEIEIKITAPDGSVKLSNLAYATLTSSTSGVAATGSLTAVAAASIIVGETFTLNDGTNPATVFEFTSGGPAGAGNVAVNIAAAVTANDVATACRSAINGVGAGLAITAAVPVGAVVGLTNDALGAAGNTTSSETVANTGFVLTNMTGGVTASSSVVRYDMKNPTIVGGPYTIAYAVTGGLAAVDVSIAGFAITVTVNGTSHTAANVISAINNSAVVSTILTASLTSGTGTNVVGAISATNIAPQTGVCLGEIVLNDNLFNRLDDSTAQFLTDGVKAGDTIEIPLDPNAYGPDAFSGRLLTYTVASVLTENRILITAATDDTATTAVELPHYYSRDLQNRYLTTSGSNAMNYRVRRQLSKDAQVEALVTTAQSIRSKRATLAWPDTVQVSDLRNGALPRSSTSVRALAGDVPGYYVACQVGGACAGLPAQHGLTNLGLSGVNVLRHSQSYFTEKQLTMLSDGGFFVMIQNTPGALPICIHQLTTDPSALETGELSVVKNVDFISKFFLDLLEPFIGVYNVTQATQNAIFRAISDGAEGLTGRSLDRIGPPLISGQITSLKVSDFDASRIEVYFRGVVPRPLNTIAFHLVV